MYIRKRRTLSLLLSAIGLLASATLGQDRSIPKVQGQESINKTFENPDLNPDEFVDRFETESREVFVHREALAAILDLKPGSRVADIGAGTGLFTLLFAEKVAPSGVVYSVDIAPAFLALISARAESKGLSEIISTVQGTQDETNLEPGSVDVVFICDTYHHFENPDRMLDSIRQALRPGGRMVLVEFDKQKANNDFVEKHIRANKDIFIQEITSEGFEMLAIESTPELRENFVAVFAKTPGASGDLHREQGLGRGRAQAEVRP